MSSSSTTAITVPVQPLRCPLRQPLCVQVLDPAWQPLCGVGVGCAALVGFLPALMAPQRFDSAGRHRHTRQPAMTSHNNTSVSQQQQAATAKVMAEQAAQVEAALIATGTAAVEAMAANLMAQAQANAAAAIAQHAADVMQEVAAATGADLEALSVPFSQPEIEAAVIDLQPVPIALPASAAKRLPAGVRMANALPPATPTKSAKRRARRTQAQSQD